MQFDINITYLDMFDRYEGLPWTQTGCLTRSMTAGMKVCSCEQFTMWVGCVGFKRSGSNFFKIENADEWDTEKFGPAKSPLVKNTSQLVVKIWKDMPMWATKNRKLDFQDPDKPMSYYFASKEMYFCNNSVCGEVISDDSDEKICIFCGFDNSGQICQPYGVPADISHMEKTYPDRFGPLLKGVRDWFRDIPSLSHLGIETGIVNYRFGMHLRRQLKFVPKPFFQESEDKLGWLNMGETNLCQMAPAHDRYDMDKENSWYNTTYRSFFTITEPIFDDKGYLLGSPAMETKNSGSNGWV